MAVELNRLTVTNGLDYIPVGKTFSANVGTKENPVIMRSCIDHIYVGNGMKLESARSPDNGMSDHTPIVVEISNNTVRPYEKFTVTKRSYRNYDAKAFNLHLAAHPWEEIFQTDDVNEKVKLFTTFITNSLDVHAPMKKFTITSKYRSGLSEETRLQLNLRNGLQKELRQSKGAERAAVWLRYKKARNRCVNLVRRDNKNYVKNMLKKHSTSPKDVWKLSDSTNSNDIPNKIKLAERDGEIEADNEVAEVFNNYFKSKIASLREKVDTNKRRDPMGPLKAKTIESHLVLKPVSEALVGKKIRTLKNKASCGKDGITSKILKDASAVLLLPLTQIINSSIRNGVFPSEWKEAQITPILKKGAATEKSNYRPVSLLSVASKVCEMVVHDQLSEYFERNGLLPQDQHAFRKNRSTTTALTSVCSRIFSQQLRG